jgi:predicted secreted hydrolase
MRVWVEDWRLEQVAPHEGPLNARMRIADSGLELDLELRNVQPLIDANEIREQGPERTAPFQFYVQPRVSAKGTLQLGERQTTLGGTLAVEHAWGELPLPGGPVAQDRFTLHLDDGRELFCLRIHRVDGSGAPTTTGLLIGRDNRPLVLSTHEIELKPTAYWVSDLTRARYPIGWVLRVPRQEIDLKLVPYWEHQEGIAWLPFWAGPVRLRGSSATSALSGDGLVQLTGYNAL